MSQAAFDSWDILTATDHELFDQLNRTAEPLARLTIAEQILAVGERQPDRLAIKAGSAELSYGQLIARAAAVARELDARGLRPGELCAFFADKTIDLYPALLGAHLAGLVIAPLDLTAPAGLARPVPVPGRGAPARDDDGAGRAGAARSAVAFLR